MELRKIRGSLALSDRIRRKLQPSFQFVSFVISLSPFFDLGHCN